MSQSKSNKEEIRNKGQEGRTTMNKQKRGRGKSNNRKVNYDKTSVAKFDHDIEDRGWSKTSKSNDVSWYAKSPELLRSAASLPFSTTTGSPLPFQNGESVPGVLGIYWAPFIGKANYAVKAAQDSIYSYTVHANSRNKSYDAPDEMLLILAGSQVFSFLALGIRAYGIMRYYSQQNRYLPKALVRAMGFDYDDLRDNLANMWFVLNEQISRVSQIWIPNTMPFIERQFWLNSNIYMDGDSIKSQYYVFAPNTVYMYNETASEQGGSLTDTGWDSHSANTWTTYLNTLNKMINALVNSQDRGIIFGDILKAYGEDKIYRMSPITADYQVTPVYDREVLTQIENLMCWPVRLPSVLQNVDTQMLYQDDATFNGERSIYYVPSTSVLNFHFKEVPTPEQIMVATRLKPAGMLLKASQGKITGGILKTSGTEYVYNCVIYYYSESTGEDIQFINVSQKVDNTANSLAVIRKWVAFDWAPWLYELSSTLPTIDDNEIIPQSAYGDYDNYTTINDTELSKMHRTACYSEFGVPAM